MLNLNLGCGEFAADGWVNVDATSNDQVHPDVIADVSQELPFVDDCATLLYAGHVLEHLNLRAAVDAARRWRRVLRLDGLLCVVGPDVDRATIMLNLGRITQSEWNEIRYGACRWPGDEHRWYSTWRDTMILLRRAGWYAERVTLEEAESTFPVASLTEWQFALLAKPLEEQ